jgi:hypothetical protein
MVPPTVDSDLEVEQRLIDEGVSLRMAGRDTEALTQFRQAYALRRSPKALAQVALAEEALAHWTSAHSQLQQALTNETDPWISANRAILEQELTRIQSHLGQLTLEFETTNTTLTIDGESIDTRERALTIFVNPGTVNIDVSRNGYVPLVRKLLIREGARYHESIRLVEEESVGPQLPASVGERSDVRRPLISVSEPPRRNPLWLGVAAGGGALTLAAAIPWLVADHKVTNLARQCQSNPDCDWDSASASVRALDRTTNVLLFSGLITTAAALTLYWTWPNSSTAPGQLSASLAPGGLGLAYRQAY